jgi:hypothetical protein
MTTKGFEAYEIIGIGIPNPRSVVRMPIPEGLSPEQLAGIEAAIDLINTQEDMTPEDKIAFIRSKGWNESCLYDDRYNPPDPSYYRDGQLVFDLDEAYRLAYERHLPPPEPKR